MARASKALIRYLTFAEMLRIHRELMNRFGGGFFVEESGNLRNPESLKFVLEEIQGSLFGKELHNTLIEKAAILAWRIIRDHVFFDGNKRTGMVACYLFLDLNGYELKIEKDLIDVSIKVALGDIVYSEFLEWLKLKVVKHKE